MGLLFIHVFKACIQSFGENCQYSCSTNCLNKTCDRFTGDGLCVCEEGSNGRGRYLYQLYMLFVLLVFIGNTFVFCLT